MGLTAKGLVDYVKGIEKIKTVYMWGSFGQKVTESFITQKATQYPSWYTTARVNKFKSLVNNGAYAFDCVGLIKSYIWGGIDNHKYNSEQDKSADGMYNIAKVKGDMSTLPEKLGVLVWMSGHIGVYIGNGEVIEATPAWKDGVQRTKLSQRKWQGWCECPYIEYEEEVKEEVDLTVEDAKKIVQSKTGLEDSTMMYLGFYKYSDELFKKLAKSMQ